MLLKIPPAGEGEKGMSYVYRTLKQNIMDLTLYPGQIISEKDISEILKVSRTPIRESLLRLKSENLVEIYPQRASYISRIDFNWIEESLFMRRVIETEIMSMAVEESPSELVSTLEKNLSYQKAVYRHAEEFSEIFTLDSEFHDVIYSYYGKKRIWENIKTFSTHYDRLRFIYIEERDHIQRIIRQHQEIIRVIQKKQVDRVENVVSKHLMNFQIYKKDLIKKHEDFFKP